MVCRIGSRGHSRYHREKGTHRTMPSFRTYRAISYEAAARVVEGLVTEAGADGGRPVVIAVADDRGDLMAFARMDGAPARSVAIAINKAYTSARTRQSTLDLEINLSTAGRTPLVYTDPHITTFPGGVPITDEEGTVIGGVGVSGRLPDEDDTLAANWEAFLQAD
jgi:glc operon protein GlcG